LTVTTYWKAYPSRVDYNLDGSSWENITTNLRSSTTKIAVPISDDSHTLNFAESSSQKTKFSWTLYVPVDSVPEAYITTYAYDTYGNVISVTSPDAVTVTMSYSGDYSHAYRTEMSTVAGSDTIIHKAAYDYYKGWITSRQNPDGTEYRFYYDLLGRIIKREYPLLSGQSERSYEQAIYDDANNIVILIDTSGHYVTKHFDKLGRLTATKICSGTYGSGALYSTVSLAYRFDSRAVSVTDAENNTSTYSYDFLGRCTQKTAPDSAVVCYSYDDTNNKITFTSPTGFDTVQWFDWGGRLVKMEEEYAADSFAVTTYQYNEIGQVTSITDAENHVTSFFYESPFGLTKRSFPDGTYEEFKYDDAGSLVFSKDRGKNQTTIMYDAICRVTQVHYYDQSTTTLAYDLNSNVIQVIDNSPTPGDYIEYEYDTWNRVVKETKHISSQTYTVEAEYNTASQITKLTYPDSMQILYTYTDLGGIAEIKRYIDGVNDEILMHNTQHSIKGLLTQFEYGNGLAARFSYDDRDRLLTIDIESGETSYLDLGYAHDNKSNVTQIVNGWRDVQSNWHSQTESFTYDGLNRLMSADCASWSHTYSYDKTGNRTAKDRITYTVNAMGEVTALSDGTTFTYNSIGSRTGKTTGSDSWVYMYNALNQLTQIEKNGETLGEYVYDGNGRRIQVTENGETTTYAYFGRVLMYEENAVGFATYIHGPGGKVAKRTTIDGESHIFFYHADHLGSTRLVTDETATIVTAVAYHPFGEIDIQEGAEKYLFSGNEIDATGLYYFGARYYDAELGRFLTVDPIPGSTASSQSMNRYNYCMNNPVSYTDPWGERPDIPSDVRDFWHSAWDLVYLLPHKVYLGPQASADSSDINKTLGVIVVSFLQEGTTVYYEGEQYTLWSPAIRKGNVAIAIANRNSLICYNYQQGVGVNPEPVPIYQGEPGLLIFFFGEDGSVEDIQFIPFKDLPESYGDDLGDALADAVNKMLDYTNGDTAILSDIIWALKGVCKLKMGDVEGALELFGKAGLVLDTADLSETFGLIPEVPGPVGWTLTFLDKANRAIWDYWDEMFKALDCLQFYLQMRL
jgi:RHS repeat-associated protein